MTHHRTGIGTFGFVRGLALAAAAVFSLSVASSQRAEAMSPIAPGASPAKAASDGVIQVRGGHGGGHGGFHGGFHGGGFSWWWTPCLPWRRRFPPLRGFHHGGYRVAHFHHHRRYFYGSYYPSYYASYPRCRIV